MKRPMHCLYISSVIIGLISWGVIGIKIFNNNYNYILESYIMAACFVVMAIYNFYRIISDKCPHCGKVRFTSGSYCSYCGKKIGKQ